MTSGRRILGIVVAVAGASVAVGVLAWQRREAGELRSAVQVMRGHARQFESAKSENVRLRSKQVSRDEWERMQADHAALSRLREEIETLRKNILARERAAGLVGPPDPKAGLPTGALRGASPSVAPGGGGDRDPEKGLTEYRYFRDVGSATPTAAFQTLVWAAMNGDDARFGSLLSLSDTHRQAAEELRDRLPARVRARFPTVERQFAFEFVNDGEQAAQIVGVKVVDAWNAIVSVKTPSSAADVDELPMRLGAGGWQLVVPENSFGVTHEEALARALRAEAERTSAKPSP